MSDTWAETASLTGCGASYNAIQGADWQEAQNWEVGKDDMEIFIYTVSMFIDIKC